jgi:hypothetical protein
MQLPPADSSPASKCAAIRDNESIPFNPETTQSPTKSKRDGNILQTFRRHWRQTLEGMRRPKEQPMTYMQQQAHYQNYFDDGPTRGPFLPRKMR